MKQALMQLPRWYKVLMIVNVLLAVAGFCVPPLGVIDPSVLGAIGELTIMGLIGLLPYLLNSGADIKLSKGDTTIEVDTPDN